MAGSVTDDRTALGPIVERLLASGGRCGNPFDTMVKSILAIRIGCVGITLLATGSFLLLGWLMSSRPLTITAIVIGTICALLTIKVWRKTRASYDVLTMASRFPKDSATPQHPSMENKRRILNAALTALGYPTVEALEAAGEVRTPLEMMTRPRTVE